MSDATNQSYRFRYKRGYVNVINGKTGLSVYYEFKNIYYLPIVFYTIVINGWPFISYHYNVFNNINRLFQWHIIEGYAKGRDNYKNPSSTAQIKEMKYGKSIDKTTEYIDYLLENHPRDVVIHRKPYSKYWRDKIEMISVMHYIKFSCIMMQVDVDELWTSNQILTISSIFENRTSKRCMYFHCHYFITKKYVTITPNRPSHMNKYEWIRAWKYDYGDIFISHGPPILLHHNMTLFENECYLHSYTENKGLVFTHYSYTEDSIVRFKDSFYGKNVFNYSNWVIVNNYKV